MPGVRSRGPGPSTHVSRGVRRRARLNACPHAALLCPKSPKSFGTGAIGVPASRGREGCLRSQVLGYRGKVSSDRGIVHGAWDGALFVECTARWRRSAGCGVEWESRGDGVPHGAQQASEESPSAHALDLARALRTRTRACGQVGDDRARGWAWGITTEGGRMYAWGGACSVRRGRAVVCAAREMG